MWLEVAEVRDRGENADGGPPFTRPGHVTTLGTKLIGHRRQTTARLLLEPLGYF